MSWFSILWMFTQLHTYAGSYTIKIYIYGGYNKHAHMHARTHTYVCNVIMFYINAGVDYSTFAFDFQNNYWLLRLHGTTHVATDVYSVSRGNMILMRRMFWCHKA